MCILGYIKSRKLLAKLAILSNDESNLYTAVYCYIAEACWILV